MVFIFYLLLFKYLSTNIKIITNCAGIPIKNINQRFDGTGDITFISVKNNAKIIVHTIKDMLVAFMYSNFQIEVKMVRIIELIGSA